MKIAVKDVVIEFDVRKHTSEEHAMMLGNLVAKGVKLPPISVYRLPGGKWGLNDGRHRLLMAEILKWKEIEATEVKVKTNGERVAEAFAGNLGGALPPTREDFIYFVERMLEKELWTRTKILAIQPLCAPYMKYAVSNVYQRKLMAAKRAVVNSELTLHKAALQYGVREQALKRELAGASGARTTKADLYGVGQNKSCISVMFQGFVNRMKVRRSFILKAVQEGNMTKEEALQIANHESEQLSRGMLNNRKFLEQIRNF